MAKTSQKKSPRPPASKAFHLWTVTNGKAGFESQVQGVATALQALKHTKQVLVHKKTVQPPAAWRWLAPRGPAWPSACFAPPWPDILLASGRQSIPYARKVKKASKGRTFVVVLQNPRCDMGLFDVVWCPAHDKLQGSKVITTVTSPHAITQTSLVKEAQQLARELPHLPPRKVAVLLGGPNKAFSFSPACLHSLCDGLERLCDSHGVGLLISSSNRTPRYAEDIMHARLATRPMCFWTKDYLQQAPHNPYQGLLGIAEALVVTADSVNMLGEAVATGKPAYVAKLSGNAGKFATFIASLQQTGALKNFDGTLEKWSYKPINSTKVIAQHITRAFQKHHEQIQSEHKQQTGK